MSSPSDPVPCPSARILYCHCQYAQVIPKELKQQVLEGLSASGVAFDAVADLCEMAARHDPALQLLAAGGPLKIAACYPRAVKGLFHQAQADLSPAQAEVLNMRQLSAEAVLDALLTQPLQPNLPDKSTPLASAAEASPAATPPPTAH